MEKRRIYVSMENLDKLDKELLKREDIHVCLNMNLEEILKEARKEGSETGQK